MSSPQFHPQLFLPLQLENELEGTGVQTMAGAQERGEGVKVETKEVDGFGIFG